MACAWRKNGIVAVIVLPPLFICIENYKGKLPITQEKNALKKTARS